MTHVAADWKEVRVTSDLPPDDTVKVTRLPARRAKGAFNAAGWSISRSGCANRTADHKAMLRRTRLLKGGRPKA